MIFVNTQYPCSPISYNNKKRNNNNTQQQFNIVEYHINEVISKIIITSIVPTQ